MRKLTIPLSNSHTKLLLALPKASRGQYQSPRDLLYGPKPTDWTTLNRLPCLTSPFLQKPQIQLLPRLSPFCLLTNPGAFPTALHGVGCPLSLGNVSSSFMVVLSHLHKLKSCRYIPEHPKSGPDLQNHPRPEYRQDSVCVGGCH